MNEEQFQAQVAQMMQNGASDQEIDNFVAEYDSKNTQVPVQEEDPRLIGLVQELQKQGASEQEIDEEILLFDQHVARIEKERADAAKKGKAVPDVTVTGAAETPVNTESQSVNGLLDFQEGETPSQFADPLEPSILEPASFEQEYNLDPILTNGRDIGVKVDDKFLDIPAEQIKNKDFNLTLNSITNQLLEEDDLLSSFYEQITPTLQPKIDTKINELKGSIDLTSEKAVAKANKDIQSYIADLYNDAYNGSTSVKQRRDEIFKAVNRKVNDYSLELYNAEADRIEQENENTRKEKAQILIDFHPVLGSGPFKYLPDNFRTAALQTMASFTQSLDYTQMHGAGVKVAEANEAIAKINDQDAEIDLALAEGEIGPKKAEALKSSFTMPGTGRPIKYKGKDAKTKEEALAGLEVMKADAGKEFLKQIAEGQEYQEAIETLGSGPQLFNENGDLASFSIDAENFNKGMGSQTVQMLLSIVGGTVPQEIAGMTMEALEAAVTKGGDEEATAKFYSLSQKEQNQKMLEAIDNGDVDLDNIVGSAFVSGFGDMASGYFTLGGVKLAPKGVINNIFKGRARRGVAMRNLRKNLTDPQVIKQFGSILATETGTEALQENLSMSTASAASGYDLFNKARMMEAAGLALITTGPITTVSTGVRKVKNEAYRGFSGLMSEDAIRSSINRKKADLEQSYKNGEISAQEVSDRIDELAVAEDVLYNTPKIQRFEPEAKENIITNQIEKTKLERKNQEIDESLIGDFSSVFGKGKKAKNEERLKELEDDRNGIIYQQQMLNSARRFRGFVNNNKDFFNGYTFKFFNTAEDLKQWAEDNDVDYNTEKNAHLKGAIDGKAFGVKLPEQKVFLAVKETADSNRDNFLNRLAGGNVVFHEGAHAIMDSATDEEIAELYAMMDEFAQQNPETKYGQAWNLSKEVTGETSTESEREFNEEVFARMSDMSRSDLSLDNVSVGDVTVLSKVGDKLADFFNLKAKGSVDFSGFSNAEEVITFFDKYNNYNNKPIKTISLPIAKGADQEDEKSFPSEVLSSRSNLQGLLDEADGNTAMFINNAMTDSSGDFALNMLDSKFGKEVAPILEDLAKKRFDPIPDDATAVVSENRAEARKMWKEDLLTELITEVSNKYKPGEQDLDKFVTIRAFQRSNRTAKNIGIQSTVEQGGQGIAVDVTEAKGIMSDEAAAEDIDTRGVVEKLNFPNKFNEKSKKLTELAVIKAGKALEGKEVSDLKKLNARNKAFNEIFSKQLFKDVATELGKNTKNSSDFSKFINNNFEALRDIAVDNIDFQKGGGPSATWNKMKPTKEEFLAYYEAANEKTSTRSDRKKSLNNAIARQIANENRIKYAKENTSEADQFLEDTGITLASKVVTDKDTGKKLKLQDVLLDVLEQGDPNPKVIKPYAETKKAVESYLYNKFEEPVKVSGAAAEYYTRKSISILYPELKSTSNVLKVSDSTGGLDLEFVNSKTGEKVEVEVKESITDQMGGAGINFDLKTGKFSPKAKMSEKLFNIIKPELEKLKPAITEYLNFTDQQSLNISNLPREIRDEAKNKGLLNAINKTIDLQDASTITEAYSDKGEGSKFIYFAKQNKLFSLSKDNASRAPFLEGQSRLEGRLGYSGDKNGKSSGTYRVQFRLKPSSLSDGTPMKSGVLASKVLDKDFNKILERVKGVKAEARYSEDRATKLAANKGKFKFFVPYSAEDFVGLIYPTLGKGKEGDKNMQWYKENLLDPFARGIAAFESSKQQSMDDWRSLKKRIKNTPADLGKEAVRGFTNEEAIRVYLWNQDGVVPETLAKKDVSFMVKHVRDNEQLLNFAEGVKNVLGGKYPAPQGDWLAGTLATDLINDINTTTRKEHLQQWKDNVDAVYSKDNLNKLKAIYGEDYVNALENILYRMETGRNRPTGKSKIENQFMNWVNDSVATVMFLNTRSALLQTISSINFMNWSDNNPVKAAKAFANQPQFWKDFATLMNSDFLKQRRGGLKNDVNADELAREAATNTNKAKAAFAALLKAGFAPTQIADSFAISIGGASFYRNRVNTYIKQGLDQKQAEEKAMLDFKETAEDSQQSSRPDKVSMEQASGLGRVILAFANTPAQYTRLTKKAALDLINGRGDWKTNASKLLYYGAVQNIIFTTLQQALFALSFDDEEDEEEAMTKVANGIVDTLLRGSGVYGAGVATMKNMILEAIKQYKSKRTDYTKAALKLTTLSPPVDTKIRKLMSAGRAFTYKQSKKDMRELGIDVDNPAALAVGQIASALGNVPLDRAVLKLQNLKAASNQERETWEQIFLAMGYSDWQLGIKDDKSKNNKLKTKVLKQPKRKLTAEERVKLRRERIRQRTQNSKKSPTKKLERGVAGVANNDGTIEIDPNLSPVEREKTIAHEQQHIEDMKAGKLNYDDNYVYWNGKKYKRKNGKIYYNGKWYIEGHKDLPWEKRAYNAEPSTEEIKKRKKLY